MEGKGRALGRGGGGRTGEALLGRGWLKSMAASFKCEKGPRVGEEKVRRVRLYIKTSLGLIGLLLVEE